MRESGIYQMYLKNLLDRLLALVGPAACTGWNGSTVVVADFAWHSDPSRFAGTDFLPAEAGRKERHVFLHI